MGVISPDSYIDFKTTEELFGKVKRFLSSYDDASLLDDGEFDVYVKEVLRSLGIGVYRENDAILSVKNYKARLPESFSVLYAAYKCTPFFSQKDLIHHQNTISVFNDVTWEVIQGGKNGAEINCCEEKGILERITVRQYVKEKAVDVDFKNPVLLRLSPNVHRGVRVDNCQNLLASSPFEITIRDGYVYTNFTDDNIYMKFYEFPTDENGLPMIPDIEEIEKTIEWYIIFQVLLKFYMNAEVPDIQNRWQLAEQKYKEAYAEAKYLNKLPTFSGSVNMIRRNRTSNLLMIIAQQG